MINRGSRHNKGNSIANTGFCKTLPNDIKEGDNYYNRYYKLQSSITPPFQLTIDVTMEGLISLQKANVLT